MNSPSRIINAEEASIHPLLALNLIFDNNNMQNFAYKLLQK